MRSWKEHIGNENRNYCATDEFGLSLAYRPELEGSLALPQNEFGLDVIAYVGALRYQERRKVAPSSLVIRGSVKLACAIATKLHSFTASDLAQVDIHTWLELRSQLQKHHALPELSSIDFAEIPRLTWLI